MMYWLRCKIARLCNWYLHNARAYRTYYWGENKCKCGKIWKYNLWDYDVIQLLKTHLFIPKSYVRPWICGRCYQSNTTEVRVTIKT